VTNKSARALWITAPNQTEIRPESLPAPGPREVRIKTLNSAISHGTEMLAYRGQIDATLALDLASFRGSFGYPLKYGYACVGQVMEVGSQVTALRPGQVAFALHPHQTEFVIDEQFTLALPEELESSVGVFAAQVETAVNVMLDAPLKLQETVVVMGQGVVGLLITQLLARSGLRAIVAVEPSERRRELALRVGATEAIAPDGDLPGNLAAMTDGRGADLVIEVSGNPAALDLALPSVAMHGTILVASWYGRKSATLQLGAEFHRRRLQIISSQVGTLNPALAPRWDRSRRSQTVLYLLQKLTLTPLISHRAPFEDAPAMFKLIDSQTDDLVQVVLDYPDGGS
jgi:2-desacetyl-2-hydroxyethyl bacteriochlorophyllide A dehydrogenase